MKTLQEEFQDEVKKSDSTETIIAQIKALNQIHDKWELLTRLKAIAPDIATLSQGDIAGIISYSKQYLQLKADDMKLLRIEIARHRRAGIIKRHHTELDLNEQGNVKPSDKNLIQILSIDPELNEDFKKNVFSNEIDVCVGGAWYIQSGHFPRPLKNDDLNQVKQYIINKYNAEYKIQQISEGIQTVAINNSYDPLLDYLNSLKWDRVNRLDSWIPDYCSTENNAYTRWVSRLVLTAAVARAYCPGIKYDHVVVLAGDQAVMKTTLIETLASEQFFNSITLGDNDRDTIQKMQGTWIAELPEGLPFKRKEINELKNFISSKKNRERFAFERHQETYMRRSIFLMSINPDNLGYLVDDTGNRRWLPIRINGDIKIDKIKELRDQLFAEAIHSFRSGFPLMIPKQGMIAANHDYYTKNSHSEITEILANEHTIAETTDEWQNLIVRWLTGQLFPNQSSIPDQISCLDVWTNCLGGHASLYKRQDQGQRIGRILNKIGCKYSSKRVEGIPVKGYQTKDAIVKLKNLMIENVVEQAENITEWQE